MGLREEFERSGVWLFRWRSYLPLVMIGFFLLALRHFDYPGHNHLLDQWWEAFCLGISCVGIGIRIYTVGMVPKGTSGRNIKAQQADSFNTTGIYSVVRHPLYLGNFLIWLGIVLSIRSGWLLLTSLLIFWLYYERIMFAEEEYLRIKFGEAYLEWAEKTPAFFPRFKNWKPPGRPFRLRAGLGSEYSGFFAMIASYTVLDAVKELFVSGRFRADLLWSVLFFFSLFSYLVLRFLKKKTKILDKA